MQVHEGLPSYHLMVDRVRYNTDRAFAKDLLKDTQKPALMDRNAEKLTSSRHVSLAFKAVPPKYTFMPQSTVQKSWPFGPFWAFKDFRRPDKSALSVQTRPTCGSSLPASSRPQSVSPSPSYE